jgi:hypothetical protein
VSLLTISRDRTGAHWRFAGRRGKQDGCCARATGARPRRSTSIPPASSTSGRASVRVHPNAPALEGTGEIKLESADRANGYFTTRSDGAGTFYAKTSGIYLRADDGDLAVLDGNDRKRAALIERRLHEWKSAANS